MALPTLTLTDPHNLDADLPMSPTIKSPDTFTGFEFERTSGRPGTASSVADGAGKYVIIMIINPSLQLQRKDSKSWAPSPGPGPGLFPKPNRFLVACPRGKLTLPCHVPPSDARVGACMRTNRAELS